MSYNIYMFATCLSVTLTSCYFDVQRSADEWHQRWGEVDGHVFVHRHVHQHQPLRANEDRWTEGDRRRRYFYVRVFISLNTSDQGWEDSGLFFLPYRRSWQDIFCPGPGVGTCELTSRTWRCSGYDHFRNKHGWWVSRGTDREEEKWQKNSHLIQMKRSCEYSFRGFVLSIQIFSDFHNSFSFSLKSWF